MKYIKNQEFTAIYSSCLILLLVSINISHAQTPKIDSLKKLIALTKLESEHLILNQEISYQYRNIDSDQSLTYGRLALDLSRQQKNEKAEAKALFNMGYLTYEKQDRDSALVYFIESKSLAEKLGEGELQADNLMRIARHYRYDKKPDSTKTVQNLIKSVEVSKKANYDYGVARAYAKLASFYTKYNDISICENYLKKSAEYYLKIPQGNEEAAHYYNEIGDKIWNFNPMKSMDFYLKGLEYSKKHPHISVNLAKAYKLTGEPQVALTYLEQAIPKLNRPEDVRTLGIAIGQLTEVFIELEDYESADKACDEGIELLSSLDRNPKVALPQIYRNKGLVMKINGDDEAALKYFLKSNEEAIKIKNLNETIKSEIVLGNYYTLENPEKAKEYCAGALSTAQINNQPVLEIESCDCLYKIHKETNSSSSALKYYEQKVGLSDSLSTLKLKHALEIHKKISEKNTELRNQEIQKDIQAKQVKTLFISTLIGLFLVGFLAVSLKRNRKQNNEITKKTNELEEVNQHLDASNKELEDANQNLDRSNQELERFAHIASHDLKSPLRSIISFTGLLRKTLEKEGVASGQEYINYIESNGKRMSHLIEDILKYSKLSNPQLVDDDLEDVDLNDLVMEIEQLTIKNPGSTEANITFIDLPVVKWNYSKLFLLFKNLIENGLKYNQSESPSVNLYFSADDGVNAIYIVDNGIGLKEEYYDKIFEMFQRLHNHDTYEGTGIGLANCKKIVTEFGGIISVTSKIGEGSIFKIEIPDSILLNKDEHNK